MPTDEPPTTMADPRCMVAGRREFGTRPSVPSPSRREHLPPNTPIDVLAECCSGAPAEGHRWPAVSDVRRGKWNGPFKTPESDTLSLGAPS